MQISWKKVVNAELKDILTGYNNDYSISHLYYMYVHRTRLGVGKGFIHSFYAYLCPCRQ